MSSRLRFERMPEKYEAPARKLLDDAFRSLRTVLDGGWQWRDQVRGVVDTTIDTDALPVGIEVRGVLSRPTSVQLLGAVEKRSTTGKVISGGSITWEWRGGVLLIHSVDALAATTRYDATFAVME